MSARRRMRWAAVVGLTLMGVAAGTFFGLKQALQQSPEFYAQAVAIPPADQQQAGHEFERNVLALHNDLQQSGQWKRVFSASQINGWLAVDMPEKFPDLLPPSIRQPRISLIPKRLQIAFQYESEQLKTVVSLSLEIGLAEEPNTLAVRVCSAQAGWVPIPMKDFLDHISEAARRADILLRWAQQDGDPVALITIPHEHDEKEQEGFVLEIVEIRQGELTVAGRSGGIEEAVEIATPASAE